MARARGPPRGGRPVAAPAPDPPRRAASSNRSRPGGSSTTEPGHVGGVQRRSARQVGGRTWPGTPWDLVEDPPTGPLAAQRPCPRGRTVGAGAAKQPRGFLCVAVPRCPCDPSPVRLPARALFRVPPAGAGAGAGQRETWAYRPFSGRLVCHPFPERYHPAPDRWSRAPFPPFRFGETCRRPRIGQGVGRANQDNPDEEGGRAGWPRPATRRRSPQPPSRLAFLFLPPGNRPPRAQAGVAAPPRLTRSGLPPGLRIATAFLLTASPHGPPAPRDGRRAGPQRPAMASMAADK